MSNPKPRTDQIAEYQQKPRWNHLPTKAVRVPEIFLGEIEAYARKLDEGSKKNSQWSCTLESVLELISSLEVEDLIKLSQQIEPVISEKKFNGWIKLMEDKKEALEEWKKDNKYLEEDEVIVIETKETTSYSDRAVKWVNDWSKEQGFMMIISDRIKEK